MKNYTFVVRLGGCGKNPQEAWDDAVEGFMLDPGPCEEDSIEDVEELDEDE